MAKAYTGDRYFTGPKWYCLGCEQTCACSCGTDERIFSFSHKLRPPKNTKNKARFRKFLRDCPTFVNCVPEELYEDFRALLLKVGMVNTVINGKQWTYVPGSPIERKRNPQLGLKEAIREMNRKIDSTRDRISELEELLGSDDESTRDMAEASLKVYKGFLEKYEREKAQFVSQIGKRK